MDIKEIGACGAVACGVFVFGGYGLNDVLSNELKDVADVSFADRSAYMESVVAEFADAFDTYYLDTGTFVYEGRSAFSAKAHRAAFVEVVSHDSPVPEAEKAKLQSMWLDDRFCSQAEMTMFTDQGWTYTFTLNGMGDDAILDVTCKPEGLIERDIS